jgi:ankyrin repeat protein
VCIKRANEEIVDAIKARPDIKDYYGNLPLFYALWTNDPWLVQRLFKKGKDYMNLRNYRNETIFHLAAKNNALESLKILIDGAAFAEELVKKDYKGDTPMHHAAKNGHLEVLQFFIEASSPLLLDLQNDFSQTVKVCAEDKLQSL